jgi:hypothetical protein
LTERLHHAEQLADVRFGILAATVANFTAFRGEGAKILQPADFFPTLKRETTEDDEWKDMARAVFDTTGVWPERPVRLTEQLNHEGADNPDAEQDGEDQD